MSNRDSENHSEPGLMPMRSIAIESPSAPAVSPPPAGVPPRPPTSSQAALQLGSSAPVASPRGAVTPPRGPSGVQGILATGSRFGSYVVGPCVGQGGMARVYSAQHEGLQRQVALKVLTQGLVGSDEHERFVREARLAAGIKHPNVVNIFDVGVEDGVPYLVMEFLEGDDLDTSLQTETSLSEDAIIDIMVPVVAGLTAVHDAGVIHRDLKPGNIFLTRGRHDEVEPKLLDFGISRSTCRKDGKITSERGLLMGTPFYMAPETIRGAEITELSDQYSLGVVMYECATGVNPFAADSFAEVVERVTSGNYPPLSQCNTAISPKLVRIVERAMNLDPNSRYADLREMGRDLLRLAGQRTRVTWGLTFGDMTSQLTTREAEPAPTTGSFPSDIHDLAALAGTVPPPTKRRAAVFTLFGAAALLATVVLGGDTLQQYLRSPASPQVTQAMLAPLAREADTNQLAVLPLRPTVADGAQDSDLQDRDQTEADDGDSEASGIDSPRASSEVKVTRKKRKAKKTRRPRRRRRRVARKRQIPTAEKATASLVDSRPAWAPTQLVNNSESGKPTLGTNNAPILD